MAVAKIRTLVVDDSALVRSVLQRSLSQHPSIEVVGTAQDGVDAIKKIASLKPDVVTLDVEMPRLNGIGVLERVVGKVPVSFIMVSTLTQSGARVTFEALEKGAFDYITKPKSGTFSSLPDFQERLHRLVLAAARAKGRHLGRTIKIANRSGSAAPSLPPNLEKGWVVALGISCGGPQTLIEMLPLFPSDFVPIVITQHMPAQFTGSFAKHLNDACSMEVRQAKHMDRLENGLILVAPGGDKHMKIVRQGVNLAVNLVPGEKVSRHRPSVDVMFNSVAKACGPRSVGVIMTGMGSDGAREIVTMRKAGAWTIAQDEDSSVVYGMPKEAVKANGIDHVVTLRKIPLAISKLIQKGIKRTHV